MAEKRMAFCQRQRPSAGITLIELLVVISIIVLLVAVMLPAINWAREAARRASCANNLRQLGIAANAYHSAHERLPPGWLGDIHGNRAPDFTKAQYVGALVYLLPHLDQKQLFDRIKVNLNVKTQAPPWFSDERSRQLAKTRLTEFVCPSATATESEPAWAFTTYRESGFPRSARLFSGGRLSPARELDEDLLFGRTNYVGMAGRFGSTGIKECDAYQGVFTNRSRTRLEQVLDGTGKTLMFGEVNGEKQGASQFSYSWIGVGALPIYLYGPRATSFDDLAFTDAPLRSRQSFNSEHVDGVMNVCFADGSVKQLQTGIEYRILLEMCGMSDGFIGIRLKKANQDFGGFGTGR